jgi:hypothetical protein
MRFTSGWSGRRNPSRRANMAKTTIQVVWVFETGKALNVVLE